MKRTSAGIQVSLSLRPTLRHLWTIFVFTNCEKRVQPTFLAYNVKKKLEVKTTKSVKFFFGQLNCYDVF